MRSLRFSVCLLLKDFFSLLSLFPLPFRFFLLAKVLNFWILFVKVFLTLPPLYILELLLQSQLRVMHKSADHALIDYLVLIVGDVQGLV